MPDMPAWFWFVMSGLLLVVLIANIWPKGRQTPYGRGIDITEMRRRNPDDRTWLDWANAVFVPVALFVIMIALVIYRMKNPR